MDGGASADSSNEICVVGTISDDIEDEYIKEEVNFMYNQARVDIVKKAQSVMRLKVNAVNAHGLQKKDNEWFENKTHYFLFCVNYKDLGYCDMGNTPQCKWGVQQSEQQ